MRFRAALSERLTYVPGRSSEIRHFLTTIDDYIDWLEGDRSKPRRVPRTKTWDFRNLTLDHVFPQNPPEGTIGPSLQAVDSLGNLTVLAGEPNTELGNVLPGEEKIDEYIKENNPVLTRRLGALLAASDATWTESEISTRQDLVIDLGVHLFQLPSIGPVPDHSNRPKTFEWQTPRGPAYWIVARKDDSDWPDELGRSYCYDHETPNYKRIKEGDYLIVFTPTKASTNGIATLVEWAKVLDISPVEVDGASLLRATYDSDTRATIHGEMPLSGPSNGNDPRVNTQHAMNPVSSEYFRRIVER